MFPDNFSAVQTMNSSFTVGDLSEAVNCLFACSFVQVQLWEEAT